MNRSIKKRYINWFLFVLNILCILYTFLKCILCPNEILKAFKTFGIKCLGIVLSWMQVWCKRIEGDRRCDNFCLLT